MINAGSNTHGLERYNLLAGSSCFVPAHMTCFNNLPKALRAKKHYLLNRQEEDWVGQNSYSC